MAKIALPVYQSATQFVINTAYVNYIIKAGHIPVLITPVLNAEKVAEECDGLLLPGGIDIDPTFYGENNISSFKCDPERDDFERELLYAFINTGKRIFGICRGFQLIVREYLRICNNIEMQDIQYYQNIGSHNQTAGLDLARTNKAHSVYTIDSLLFGVKVKQTLSTRFVNSIHHQGVVIHWKRKEDIGRPKAGLFPVAFTKHGITNKGKGFILEACVIKNWGDNLIKCVQWHPEELMTVELINNFFSEKDTFNPIFPEIVQNEQKVKTAEE